MSIMRNIVNGDWVFGNGVNDYIKDNTAVALDIQTRLQCFLNDCFFDKGMGIDWFNLLGAKSTIALNLAIRTLLLNTPNVIGVINVSTNLNANRLVTVTYQVQTIYSSVNSNFVFNLI